MCKVMIMAGIKPENNSKAVAFTKLMGELMSPGNTDGLGYAAVDAEGNLFGERWLHNSKAFTNTKVAEGSEEDQLRIDSMLENLGGSVKVETKTVQTEAQTYGSFGNPDLSKMVAITLHTRAATSEKGYANTHPFVDLGKDTSLIHNGMIRNDSDFKLTLSTCDSESILISYLDNKVNEDVANVTAMASSLVGYYACGVFSRDVTGARVLDYFKGNNASLFTTYIYDLGTFIIATSVFNVKEACTKLGYTHGDVLQIVDGWLVRLNPVTGELIVKEPFVVGVEYNYQNKNNSWKEYENRQSAHRSAWRNDPTEETEIDISPRLLNGPKNLSKEMMEYLSLPITSKVYSLIERRELMQQMRGAV